MKIEKKTKDENERNYKNNRICTTDCAHYTISAKTEYQSPIQDIHSELGEGAA